MAFALLLYFIVSSGNAFCDYVRNYDAGPGIWVCYELLSYCRFGFQNGPFDTIRRAVLECKTARFTSSSANTWISTIYRMRLNYIDLSLIFVLDSMSPIQEKY